MAADIFCRKPTAAAAGRPAGMARSQCDGLVRLQVHQGLYAAGAQVEAVIKAAGVAPPPRRGDIAAQAQALPVAEAAFLPVYPH